MLTVGLTGGIACGKTLVSHALADLGAYIIDVDKVAREIQVPGSRALREIERVFGPRVIREDGSLDRKGLGRIVFASKEALQSLNEIMFPLLLAEVDKRLQSLKEGSGSRGNHGVTVVDAAILFEAGMDRLVEKVIVVYADEETRVRRLIQRDGISEEEARQRIRAQMPLDLKLGRADFVIHNSGGLRETLRQVEKVWEALTSAMPGGRLGT